MEPQLVVGLFHSSGIAEDACNRLKTEGVPASEIGLKVLKPTAPLLPTAEAELEGLSVDPLIVGDVRETFAKFIRNGETMVFVRAGTGEQAEFAAETLRQYTPVAIDVLPLSTRTRDGNSVPVTERRGTAPYTKPFSVHSSTHLKEHNMQSGNIKTADRPVEADETSRLISSEKVDGTAVYNGEGQHLGAVHHLMIDKFSGHVEYAVMSFGGFLGIGESYHPLPWRALTYSPNWGGYCVDLNRARLEQSPHYTTSTQPDWSDRAYRNRIDEYWTPPV